MHILIGQQPFWSLSCIMAYRFLRIRWTVGDGLSKNYLRKVGNIMHKPSILKTNRCLQWIKIVVFGYVWKPLIGFALAKLN